jgi:hypothetical protein
MLPPPRVALNQRSRHGTYHVAWYIHSSNMCALRWGFAWETLNGRRLQSECFANDVIYVRQCLHLLMVSVLRDDSVEMRV